MASGFTISLRTKLIVAATLIEVGLMALLVSYGSVVLRDFQRGEAHARLVQLLPALQVTLGPAMQRQDAAAAQGVIDVVFQGAGLEYISVLSASGEVLALSSRASMAELPPAPPQGQFAEGGQRIDGAAEIAVNGLPLGRVQVGIPVGVSAELRERFLLASAGIVLAVVALTALFLYLVTHFLTRGLGKLAAAARMIEHGKYRLQVSVRSRDEVGELTRAFNFMARALQEHFTALTASEQRFRALTRLAADWYWEQDRDLRFTYVSDDLGEIAGLSAEAHLGKTRWELPDTRFEVQTLDAHRRALEARQAFVDLEYARLDEQGRWRHFAISGEPVFDEQGDFAGYRGVGREITARKLVEQRIEESERRLRSTFEQAAVGMVHLALDGTILSANQRLCRILGFDPGRIEGKHFDHLLYPQDLGRDRQALEDLRAGSLAVFSGERRCLRSDASTLWCQLTVSLQRTADGTPEAFIGVIEDVSSRRQAEEALRANEARQRMLMELLPDAVIIHRNRRIVMVNRAALTLFGAIRSEEMVGRDIVECVHPDFQERVARRISYLEAHLATGLRLPSAEQIYMTLQGAAIDVEATAAIVDFADGSAILTVARDISERKEAERALAAREQLLRAMAQTVPAVLMQLDRDLRVEFVNAAALEALGRREEEVLGHGLAEFLAVARYRGIEAEFERALRGETVEREGTSWLAPERQVHETLRPRLDETGEVLGVYLFSYDITARRQAERALQEGEVRLRAVTDTIPASIIEFDADVIIRYLNRRAADAFGVAQEAALGKSLRELLPMNVAVLLEQRYRRALAGESFVYEGESNLFPDRQVQVTYVPRRGLGGEITGFYTFGYDVTERYQAEKALRASEERMRMVADTIPGVMISVNREGRFTFVNRGFLSAIHLPADQVIGRLIAEVYGAERYARLEPLVDMVLAGRELSLESSSVFHGDRVIHSTYLPQYDGERRVIGFYYFGYDITAQKTAEAEVRRLNADLERRVAARTSELEASNRELEAFAYSVAHDLRTPLRAIDGFSQAVMLQSKTPIDETMRQSLDRVRAASQRMGQMIDDLLRLARVTRGEMRRQEINLSQLAQEILFTLQQTEPRRTVELSIAPEIMGNGDPILLHAVFENLLGNAWKFTRRKTKAKIEFAQVETPTGRAYCVRDNGAGFDMAYANKLFSPFQRLHGAEEYAGNGIGLATVHRILARHGGRIWAEAAVSRGASFFFTLGPSARTQDLG